MPNFQNPTGYTYSEEEKLKVLELSKKYSFYIVEDDYSSELNFSNIKIKTLKELDKNERVIYIKSFSKIFLPGLRLGYLIVPEVLEKKISSAKHSTDIYTSGLIQKTFEVFLKDEKWAKQFDLIYEMFKQKYYIATDVFKNHLPDNVKLNKPNGGVNFWLELNENVDTNKLYDYLLKKNIIIAPGNVFYLNNKKSNSIRISVASVEKDKLREYLIVFCDSLKNYLQNVRETKKIQVL